jgi:predicted PhzF superfamily epimerase YddE/YHI9
MMRITSVDMFGTSPGRGSALDVLLPDLDRPWDEEVVEEAAAHARCSHADESALVSRCSRGQRTFASRTLNADGETPFGTHSLAGVAACLAEGSHLAPGEVGRTSADGCQWLWTDGRRVRVPFDGPLVHEEVPLDTALSRAYGSPRARAVGVGRGFTLVRVDEDPRVLAAPDLDRMRELGTTDLTVFRWDSARQQVLARVFAPGFGIAEDAGCLPVAAALGIAVLRMEPARQGRPVTVTQVTTRGTESVFTCEGTVRDGSARLAITGRVWVGNQDVRRAP